MCFRDATTLVALPILPLISSEQLLSHVIRLPMYSNLSTFSIIVPAICTACSIFLSPDIIAFVLVVFTTSYASSAAILVVSNCFCWELHSLSIRSIPSANLKLFNIVPLILTSHVLSLRWFVTLSRYMLNRSGDNGTPSLIPMSVRYDTP